MLTLRGTGLKGVPIVAVICATMLATAWAQAPVSDATLTPAKPPPPPPAPAPSAPAAPEPPRQGSPAKATSDVPAPKMAPAPPVTPTPATTPAPAATPAPVVTGAPVVTPAPVVAPAPAETPAAALKPAPAAKTPGRGGRPRQDSAAKAGSEVPAPKAEAAAAEKPPAREERATKAGPIVEPPAAAPQPISSAAQPTRAAPQDKQRGGFFDIKVTDVALALFAAVLVFFMFRLWRMNSGLREAIHTQAADNRRAIAAGERAAESAALASEAAAKTITALRETADRQARAYVTARQFHQGPSRDDKEKLMGWLFQVVWQNTGATPTRGLRFWQTVRVFDNLIPADFDYAPPTAVSFAGGELGPGSSTASGTIFLPQNEIPALKSGKRRAIFYGEARYGDLLSQHANRITQFCVEIVIIGEANGAHPSPFTFTYHPKHNELS